MAEIWAVLEYSETTFHEHSGELLAELAEVAQRQQTPTALCAILLIAPDTTVPDTTVLTRLGVQHLYLLEHPLLAYYTTHGYVSALIWLIQQRTPALIATSATANGRDWAPRLAARLQLPSVPGCLGLDLYEDALFALHSVYEGRAYTQTRTALHGRTGLVTLIPGVRGTPPEGLGAINQAPTPLATTHFTPVIQQSYGQERIRRLAIQAPSPEQVELDAAEKIVAGGRGVSAQRARVYVPGSISPVASLALHNIPAACARHRRWWQSILIAALPSLPWPTWVCSATPTRYYRWQPG